MSIEMSVGFFVDTERHKWKIIAEASEGLEQIYFPSLLKQASLAEEPLLLVSERDWKAAMVSGN